MINALSAEFLKLKHAKIVWVTFIAFLLGPVMGGVFLLIMRNPEAVASAGALVTKARLMNFGSDWNSYLSLLNQVVGVGGEMIFGFVASWIFGREYSDQTAKDLLALPTSRTTIINAKFIIYALWCIALTLSNLITGGLIGLALQLPSLSTGILVSGLQDYFMTTLLTLLLGTPIAFFAMWGKGYLAPLGFVVLAIVFSQIIAAVGYGTLFPWAIPGIFSGAAGDYKEQLTTLSYILVVGTSAMGYLTTQYYWKYTDQVK